jgi:hypothetical protein
MPLLGVLIWVVAATAAAALWGQPRVPLHELAPRPLSVAASLQQAPL